MVKLEKWAKGAYYSCPHQTKASIECIICDTKLATSENSLIKNINSQKIFCGICRDYFGSLFEFTYKNNNFKQTEIVIGGKNMWREAKENGKWVCDDCKNINGSPVS